MGNDIYKQVLQSDYCAYVMHTHHGTWKLSKFHRFLCDTIQEFVERPTEKAFEILILSCPPQHGKSITITETLPSWFLGRHPDKRVIEISYNEDFAIRFGRRNRSKVNEYGKDIFGIELADSPNSNVEFEIKGHRGGMISRGILSGVTGNPAELMIIDDPVKTRQEADSETRRAQIWDEWLYSFRSRIHAGGKVIVIMTRWHEDDLAGRLIANEENVTVINLPLEAEKGDILGRQEGEALCPEIGKDNAWLSDFKKVYQSKEGSMAWNALYQGHPTSAEGNMIKREWWKFYKELPDVVDWLMSVDAAFKDGEDNDFVAIQVWAKKDANMFLVDAVKRHLNMPDTMREIVRLRGLYPKCITTLIEDKANGSAIIQYLRTHLPGIIAVDPKGGKVARVNAVIGAIESGNVYLPEDKNFTGDFIEECAMFPNGAHDDQVDCMSQGLNRFIYYNAATKVIKEPTFIEKYFPMAAKKNSKKRLDKGDKIHAI